MNKIKKGLTVEVPNNIKELQLKIKALESVLKTDTKQEDIDIHKTVLKLYKDRLKTLDR